MHLSNVRKLDVSSRSQLVAALVAGEPAPVI
jgi:DNA-binding CsgD family transcriptional regulator